jgi:hypothetical protein
LKNFFPANLTPWNGGRKAEKHTHRRRRSKAIVRCEGFSENGSEPVKVFDILKAIPSLKVFASIQELDRYLDVMQKRVQ